MANEKILANVFATNINGNPFIMHLCWCPVDGYTIVSGNFKTPKAFKYIDEPDDYEAISYLLGVVIDMENIAIMDDYDIVIDNKSFGSDAKSAMDYAYEINKHIYEAN